MTMKKLVDIACVSVSTVSKAFSGSLEISEEKREFISYHNCVGQRPEGYKSQIQRRNIMRKKLQDKMFETSYLIELFISLLVGIAVVIMAARVVVDMFSVSFIKNGIDSLVIILDKAITLAIGAELIKMLCKHTPETIIEVLAFALARQLIVGHTAPWENLLTVSAIAILFAVRRFLFNRHDMVETPDGLVEIDNQE